MSGLVPSGGSDGDGGLQVPHLVRERRAQRHAKHLGLVLRAAPKRKGQTWVGDAGMYALLDSGNGLPVHERGEDSMFVLTLDDVERMLRVTAGTT